MFERKIKEKGIVLFIVLATIFIVILLANILIGIMASQSRLTHHKTSRIQAYYAAMAGINYALEMLRVGNTDWVPSPDTSPNTRTRTIGRPCPPPLPPCTPPPPCPPPPPPCTDPDVMETEFPYPIRGRVVITVEAVGSGINGTRKINATAPY